MTQEQEAQFKSYGCVCRCLLFLAHESGKPMSIPEFIDKFSPLCPIWEIIKQCGSADVGMAFDIARKLEIVSTMNVHRNPDIVRKYIEGGAHKILLFTEKFPDKHGAYTDYFHCSVVLVQKTSPKTLEVFHPFEKIVEGYSETLSNEEIDQRSGYFAVFH